MPQAIALGLLALALLMLLGRLFVRSSPATLARLVKWFAIGLLMVVLLLLVLTGRLPILFAFFGALIPWLIRFAQLHALWRHFKNAFSSATGWRTAGTASTNTSQVETRWLRMTLDHDSGHLDGDVLDGPFIGRKLSRLSFDEALRLYRDIEADAQSRQLMESWLDRAHPDWRDQPAAAAEAAPGPSGGRMTRDEAFAVLGVTPDASGDEVKAAHRRLMMACHPDHGGSDWLAARLNQAKDVLLGA